MQLTRNILENIENEVGSSFYILDLKQYEENYNKLLASFRAYYPKTKIAYSYKTNYVPIFCKFINSNGGFAEVVSGMEMTLARKIGVSHENIFFNGPIKDSEYTIDLLANGGIVNIDSVEELEKIEKISREYPNKILKVGVRLNFDVEDGVLSRFGFDIESDAFLEAIEKIKNHPKLELTSLHCHFATRSILTWTNRTKGMLNTIDKFFKNDFDTIKFVSLGGGLYGDMPDDMRKQFPIHIPTFDEYAEVASKVFAKYFDKTGLNKPTLIIEPGTALVANAVKYVTKVESIKTIREKTIATLYGSSYNINPTANRKNVPINIFSINRENKHYENVDFAGYTCIESDYLYRNYTGNLEIGDFIVFNEVGSYSIVMKPPFIMPNVAIIEPDNEEFSSFGIVKRRETFEDIFHTYGL